MGHNNPRVLKVVSLAEHRAALRVLYRLTMPFTSAPQRAWILEQYEFILGRKRRLQRVASGCSSSVTERRPPLSPSP